MRSHFKHSVELVDGEGDIVDILAAVEDFLLAQATYQAARQRWPKERHSTEPADQNRGGQR